MAADTPKIRKKHTYEGVKYWNFCLNSSIEDLKNFDVRCDDVFVVSYPRSGTHWTMEMVGLILNDGYPDKIDRTLYSSPLSTIDMRQHLPSTRAEELLNPPDMTPILERARTVPSPRVMHTHVQHRYLPPDLPTRAKVIYVLRNPKDASISRYNFYRGELRSADQMHWNDMLQDFMTGEGDQMNWNKMLHDFMTGDIVWGSWNDHVFEYWQKWRDNKHVLFLVYENMKKYPGKTIRQIAKHLGRPLSDDLFNRVAEHSSFGGMKETFGQTSRQPDTNGMKINFSSGGGGKFKFLNKGTCGNWKENFTVAQNEAFDHWYGSFQEKMDAIGLNLAFE